MSQLSTHVLDTALGSPAGGVTVALERDGSVVARGTTDADGRIADLGPDPGLLGLRVPGVGVVAAAALPDAGVPRQGVGQLGVGQLQCGVVALLQQRGQVGVRPPGDQLPDPAGHAEAAGDELPSVVRRQRVEVSDPHPAHRSHAAGPRASNRANRAAVSRVGGRVSPADRGNPDLSGSTPPDRSGFSLTGVRCGRSDGTRPVRPVTGQGWIRTLMDSRLSIAR